MAFGCPLTWKKESIYTVAGVNAHIYWSGRTSRASAHMKKRVRIRGCRSKHTCLLERTHEPCVPTCVRAARHFSHFTHRLGHDRYVGTHGSCVRSHGNESPYTRLQEQTHMFVGADARAVRPYIRSSGSSSRPQ